MGLSRPSPAHKGLTGAGLLLVCLTAAADDGDFVARCEQAAGLAQVAAVFEDREVERDDSRSIAQLKEMSQPGTNRSRQVLGLTHAEPTARLEYSAVFVTGPGGRVCGVPSVTVRLAFARFQVFIAREVANACRHRIVYEHELQHVAAWRSHLRAGARLLTPTLQRNLAGAQYFPDRRTAQVGLRLQVDGEVTRWLEKLKEGATAAQQQIDTPQSYRDVERRLAACR